MTRHYIALIDGLEPYTLRIVPDISDSWREAVFNDITAGGKSLTYVPLPRSIEGERVGLCGDLFFCEASPDHYREDALFVFRIESADARLPPRPPHQYEAEFELLKKSTAPAPKGDPLILWDGLLTTEHSRGQAATADAGVEETYLPPNPALRQLLMTAPEPLRSAYRPSGLEAATMEPRQLAVALGRLWKRFGTLRRTSLTGRVRAVITLGVRPTTLNERERAALLEPFGMASINAVANDSVDKANVYELLEHLATVGFPKSTRRALWAAMLSGLTSAELRRVLHEAAPVLVDELDAAVAPWHEELLLSVSAVAERRADERLREVVETAQEEKSPGCIVRWVLGLEIRPSGKVAAQIDAQFDDVVLPTTAAVEESTPTGDAESNDTPDPVRSAPPIELEADAVSAVADNAVSDGTPVVEPPTDESPVSDAIAPPITVESQLFCSWVRKLHTVEFGLAEDISCALRDKLSLFDDHHATSGFGGITALVDDLNALDTHIHDWLADLPREAHLAQWEHDAKAAVSMAAEILGDEIPLVLGLDVPPTVEELGEIVEVLKAGYLLDAAPDWLWSAFDETDSVETVTPRGTGERGACLTNAELRAVASSLVARLDGCGPELLDQVHELPRPADPSDLEGYFESAVGRIVESRRRMGAFVESQPWVLMAVDEGADDGVVLRCAQSVETLEERVSGAVHGRLLELLEQPRQQSERQHLVASYELVTSKLEQLFGKASNFQVEEWENFQNNLEDGDVHIETEQPVGEARDVAISHNWVDQAGARVPLRFQEYPAEEGPYGFVAVPLVLECGAPVDLHIELKLNMKTRHRWAWPNDWRKPHPETLRVSRALWYRDGDKSVFGFKYILPIRPPETVKDTAFSFSLQGVTPQTDDVVVPEVQLKWNSVGTAKGRIPIDWKDIIETTYVVEHPIGPQQHHEEIEQRLKNGNSFAAIAPRRYGKSTLVEYFHELSGEDALFAPRPIVCTRYREGRRLNYHRLWRELSEQLQEEFGAGITGLSDIREIPGRSAFDHVRRMAATRGFKTIVLLFDEAQLFFHRRTGPALGSILKDNLERHWARPTRDGRCALVMGFVGLPSFLDRCGPDLLGHLQPKDPAQLKETRLNRLLLNITQNRLHTTRLARQRMTQKAGNLFVLKVLVERLVDRLSEEGRDWASHEDVLLVESEVRQELGSGGEVRLAPYMRDLLNDAESINDWEPKACYPLAVALASVGPGAGTRGPRRAHKRIAEAMRLLDEWCTGLLTQERTVFRYTDERVEIHLRTLGELKIYDRGEFASDLFESYLVGASNGYPKDEADKKALIRGAVKLIRVPDGLERVAEGGQARVYRFTRDGTEYALRRVTLDDEKARLRFLETIHTLSELRHQIRREQGSEYIYDLTQIGLSEDGDEGIEIYRWINGVSLDQRTGQLGVSMLVFVAERIALALRLMHRFGVLHRDICPRNVIISDDRSIPVLIDFGLARHGNAAMFTQISSDGAAPEVKGKNPLWTKASDVYSFGWTIRKLTAPGKSYPDSLESLVETCLDPEPSKRPTAGALFEGFAAIALELKLDEKQRVHAREIEAVAGDDLKKPWFAEVLEKFKPQFGTLRFGLHENTFDRCATVAGFLDQILEAYPSATDKTLKLGYVKNSNQDTGDDLAHESIAFAWNLRRWRSHHNKNNHRRTIEDQFAATAPGRQTELIVEAAHRISMVVGLSELRSLAETALRTA